MFFQYQYIFSADVFNNNLTAEERARLASGEILIRNIGKAKNISLAPVNQTAKQTIDAIQDLNPSYLAEVIQIRPYNPGENLIDRVKDILTDIPAYKGIPYWSVTNRKWFELYSSAKVLSRKNVASGVEINAELVMPPFTPIDADIKILTEANSLFYRMVNNNKLKIEGITMVQDNSMNSYIIIFRDGDSLILYGIGGVKAPSVFFLRERVETSFMNRIKTFCMYVYEKL
jgi:hypothetical protein